MGLLDFLSGDLGSLVGPVIGGILGSQGNQSQSTSQSQMDPRMAEYVYGQGGVLPAASRWYGQNQSGLNDKMLTGMNNQWAQLGASKPGFDRMQGVGMGLLGGSVAGNPFSNGYQTGLPGNGWGGAGGSGGGAQQGGAGGYNPATFGAGTGNAFTAPATPQYTAPSAPSQLPQQAQPDWATLLGGFGNDRGGNQDGTAPGLSPEQYAGNVANVNSALGTVAGNLGVNRAFGFLDSLINPANNDLPANPVTGMTVNETSNRAQARDLALQNGLSNLGLGNMSAIDLSLLGDFLGLTAPDPYGGFDPWGGGWGGSGAGTGAGGGDGPAGPGDNGSW